MSYDPVQILSACFREAIGKAVPEAPDADPLITPSRNPKFGDFQSNAAMGLGKRLGKPPREIAEAIVGHLDVGEIAEPVDASSIAGPGFINVTLRSDAIGGLLSRLDKPDLGIDPAGEPETVVVDLCGVNLAKQMHVGHLRASIIGDCLARVFERLGHNVIRQNHVGDWGLPIAMVAAKLRSEADAGRIDLDAVTLDDLDRLYKIAKMEATPDTGGLAAARKWWSHPKAIAELEAQVEGAEASLADAKETLVRLQSHDPAAVAIWQRLVDVTMEACMSACQRLHTKIDASSSAGESSYAEELAGVVADLEGRGITEESDGALVIRNAGIEEPTIVRKRDGGFLYATTDMAAIRRRVQQMGADRIIYTVDARQALHFKQVFASAITAGYATRPGHDEPARLEHAPFGMVLGEDNKPFKTRSGENVKLADLLDDAIVHAGIAVRAKSEGLSDDEQNRIAEVVGIAAIKYADLSNDRVRDYVFSFDRMLEFEGNTGPYLLYNLVRIKSIFRKAVERFGEGVLPKADAPFVIGTPEEKDLALWLLRYPGVIRSVGDSLEPHRLCGYLYDLSSAYSVFFTNCPVLKAADEQTRAARLKLCALTDRVLTDGLGVLGIETLERM